MNNYSQSKKESEFKDALSKLDGFLDNFNDLAERAKYMIVAKFLMIIFLSWMTVSVMSFIKMSFWALLFPALAVGLVYYIDIKQKRRKKNAK